MTGRSPSPLLVVIDTESDNQWSAEARRRPTFDNTRALSALHERFQRHGIRPTYVVTYPVITDPASADVLATLMAGGDCEVGAHHHAWETPPCTEADADRHPYALQLPHTQFEAQLAALTTAIAAATGSRPRSYRSGRFGFSASHVAALEREGYLVDSSVAPLFYEAHKGGPDFVGAPLDPYFLAYDSAVRPGTSNVLEVPVSAALNRRLPATVERWYGRAPRPYETRRLLRLLGIARLRWLRPSYSSAEDMIALGQQLVDRGAPLNLIFHSSEAIAGASPYTRTAAELEAFFDRLDRFLVWAVRERNATPRTLNEFRYAWVNAEPDRATA